jgi:hypothetical protein
MNIPQPAPTPNARAETIWRNGLLAATVFNCALQIAWFWRFRAHSINEDGIAYIGLGRHLSRETLKPPFTATGVP